MRRFFLVLLPMFLLAPVIWFSGCQFTTAHFEDVTMARKVKEDHSPVDRTTFFYKHDKILHCCANMKNVPSDTRIKAVWSYQSETSSKTVIDSAEITLSADSWIDFSLTPAGIGFPYGRYFVELYIDDDYDRTHSFTIKPMFEIGPVFESVIATQVSENYFPVIQATEIPTSIPVIYAAVFVENAKSGTVVSANWYSLTENEMKKEIGTQDYPCEGTGWIGFTLRPNNSLPIGEYYADITSNSAYVTTLAFSLIQ